MKREVAFRRIGALATLMLIVSCAACGSSDRRRSFVPENEQLQAALIGVWGISVDGGKTFWGYDEFLPDGTIVSTGTLPGTNEQFRLVGKMRIKGRVCCITVIETSDPQTLPVGTNFCVEVLHINGLTQRYKDIDGGKEKIMYRTQKPR
jgi:hypothetical protein